MSSHTSGPAGVGELDEEEGEEEEEEFPITYGRRSRVVWHNSRVFSSLCFLSLGCSSEKLTVWKKLQI